MTNNQTMVCPACDYPNIGFLSRGGKMVHPHPDPFVYLGTISKRERTFMNGEPLTELTELFGCPNCGAVRIGGRI